MGAPGSGKSTWVKEQKFDDFYIASADLMRHDRNIDPADFMNWFRRKGKLEIESGRSVVVDATNTIREHRLYWLQLGVNWQAQTKLVAFNTHLNLLTAAQKSRSAPTPSNIVWKHNRLMQSALQDIRKELWDDIEILNRN